MLEQQIEQDIKSALLSGDSWKATVLRGVKSEILNKKVELKKRDSGLSDEEVQVVLVKEAKKRGESAEIYKQANQIDRYDLEMKEKSIIEGYLPEKLSDQEIEKIIDDTIKQVGNTMKDMGKVISAVKQKTGATADGGTIARLVKDKLQ